MTRNHEASLPRPAKAAVVSPAISGSDRTGSDHGASEGPVPGELFRSESVFKAKEALLTVGLFDATTVGEQNPSTRCPSRPTQVLHRERRPTVPFSRDS